MTTGVPRNAREARDAGGAAALRFGERDHMDRGENLFILPFKRRQP